MFSNFQALQKAYKLSSLCQIIEVTLRACWEEGFPRHHLHRLPTPVVVEARGQLGADLEPQMAVILHLTRHTSLQPAHQGSLGKQHPPESLYFAMPVGSPLLIQRTRLLEEASRIFLDLAQDESRVVLAAISHRRLINQCLVIRHAPVALFSLEGAPIWTHPAASNYGLMATAFSESQRHRILGPRRALSRDSGLLNRMDEATGLPAMYAYARQCLKTAQEEGENEDPIYAAVLDFQAQSLIRHSLAADVDAALKVAAQEFMKGFETFFGMGGLLPRPGVLD